MSLSCKTVTPSSHSLTSVQKMGLNVVSWFQGRDVVFAIDLTESVGLDDEGRIRLRQIIQDSLEKGDRVYLIPFASEVDPLSQTQVIEFSGKSEDIDKILEAIPLEANITQRNTDIQRAEHIIYHELAKLNQCRLEKKTPVKPQSVVWLTDAPLKTKIGISSDIWIETPKNSPYRQPNSIESQERQKWLEKLPLDYRSQNIGNYKLTVVDIPPNVQEFCTPVPGGKETCLVTPYLIPKLWLPSVIVILGVISVIGLSIWGIRRTMSLKREWKLTITTSQDQDDDILPPRFLSHQESLSIGGGEDIDCLIGDIRGYLQRKGNRLYLDPVLNGWPIVYQGEEIKQKKEIQILTNTIQLSCPNGQQDFEIMIKLER